MEYIPKDLYDISHKKLFVKKNAINNSKVVKTLTRKLECLEKGKINFLKLKQPPKNCFLQGDFHFKNILVKDKNFVLFDFEQARIGNRELDLIRSIFSVCFKSKFRNRNFTYVESFCKGYLEECSLSNSRVLEALSFYFYENMVVNTWYEDLILNKKIRNINKVNNLLAGDMTTILYLDKNFKLLSDKMYNFTNK